MVDKLVLTFALDFKTTLNPATKMTHHTMEFQPLEVSTFNNPRRCVDKWQEMGPPAIPERAMINCYLLKDFKIKILLWNYRGANNPKFIRAL